MLSFQRLSEISKIRCEESYFPIDHWGPTDWATALAGECGEACNLIKKMRRGDHVEVEDIGRELADIIIYADLLAQRLGLDLGECVVQKFNEVSDRRGSNIKL